MKYFLMGVCLHLNICHGNSEVSSWKPLLQNDLALSLFLLVSGTATQVKTKLTAINTEIDTKMLASP